jgi:hypothetical protein
MTNYVFSESDVNVPIFAPNYYEESLCSWDMSKEDVSELLSKDKEIEKITEDTLEDDVPELQ